MPGVFVTPTAYAFSFIYSFFCFSQLFLLYFFYLCQGGYVFDGVMTEFNAIFNRCVLDAIKFGW